MTDNGTHTPAVPAGRVIVGVDGSKGSRLALEWAVAHEDVLGPVVPVATFHLDLAGGDLMGGTLGSPSLHHQVLDSLREGAADQLARSLEGHPEVADRARVVEGRAGPALVREAEGATLLVVGSRGRSALAETLLGSVANYCVKHATVPVAVIPEGTEVDSPLTDVVVAVDGSDNASAALGWAVRHLPPGGRVTAVACQYPAPYALEVAPPAPLPPEEAKAALEAAVERSLGPDVDDLPIDLQVADGDPRVTLRHAAAEADLLVLGARGHRGVAYLLLGSVTSSLVHHAVGPTVVVPA